MSLENEFIDLCLNGKLNEAKEFYKNNPTIDISANSEYAFKYACGNGHLEIAQWLYTINPTINISADDEIAFRSEEHTSELSHVSESRMPSSA